MSQILEAPPAAVCNRIIYTLFDDDGGIFGTFYGRPGLDAHALSEQFRAECYAKAEADGDDFCTIFCSDFAAWLLARGIMSEIETASFSLSVNTSGDNKYTPTHWPICPSCHDGRGEENMGRVLHDLNRMEWHRLCTNCGHTWDHKDEPYDPNLPMLEDDGRYTPAGCVPYSISQAGQIQIDRVLSVCQQFGWTQEEGIATDDGVAAALALGLVMDPQTLRVNGTLTLRKVFDTLSPLSRYIIATRGHWLAYVDGVNMDQAGTHLRNEVISCWIVRPAMNT